MAMRIVKETVILLILSIICSATTCGTDTEYLRVLCTNKSEENIYVYWTYRYDNADKYNLSDDYYSCTMVPTDSTRSVALVTIFDGEIDKASRIVRLIVFKESTIKRYAIEEINEKQISDGWYEYPLDILGNEDIYWTYYGK